MSNRQNNNSRLTKSQRIRSVSDPSKKAAREAGQVLWEKARKKLKKKYPIFGIFDALDQANRAATGRKK